MTGILCLLCAESNSSNTSDQQLFYYVGATETAVAHCAPCGGTALASLASGLGLATGALLVLLLARLLVRHGVQPSVRTRVTRAFISSFEGLSLGVKLKIVVTFYMVASKVRSPR